MADSRAGRQLALIEEMTRVLDAADVPFWLRISPETQLWAKDELRRFLGDPERAHDAAAIELLRAFVNR